MTSPLARLFSAACLLMVCTFAAATTPQEQAAALIEKGEFMAAERLIESLARAKHPDPVVLWELSQVRTAQHQTEEAVKLAERAAKLDPTQARFFSQIGAALSARMGEASRLDHGTLANRVRKAYEKALQLDPNHVPALTGLCRYYWSAPPANGGSLAKAREFAGRIRKIDPVRGEVELGNIAARKGDFNAALTHFDAALAQKPENTDAQFASALALLQLGRRSEAREHLETVLKLKPSFSLARQALEALDQSDKLATKP